jgi:hypothetical protein
VMDVLDSLELGIARDCQRIKPGLEPQFSEGSFESRQIFTLTAWSDRLIPVQKDLPQYAAHGYDGAGKSPLGPGSRSPRVAEHRKFVHLITGIAPLSGDQIGTDTLGDEV